MFRHYLCNPQRLLYDGLFRTQSVVIFFSKTFGCVTVKLQFLFLSATKRI
jgi:hypothetical protein